MLSARRALPRPQAEEPRLLRPQPTMKKILSSSSSPLVSSSGIMKASLVVPDVIISPSSFSLMIKSTRGRQLKRMQERGSSSVASAVVVVYAADYFTMKRSKMRRRNSCCFWVTFFDNDEEEGKFYDKNLKRNNGENIRNNMCKEREQLFFSLLLTRLIFYKNVQKVLSKWPNIFPIYTFKAKSPL